MDGLILVIALAACAPPDPADPPCWSAPSNRWPSADPGCPVPEGFDVGATVPDARLPDQFGDEVALWQFSGRVTLVMVYVMWGAPGQHPEEVEALAVDRPDLVVVQVIAQDTAGDPPGADDVALWVDSFGVTGPVLADDGHVTAAIVPNGQFPGIVVVGRDLAVRARVVPPQAEAIAAAVDAAIAEP